MKEFFKQRVQKIHRNASLYYVEKLSHAIKYLKSKLLLSCQICPVIDGRLTVECPSCGVAWGRIGHMIFFSRQPILRYTGYL